MKNSSNTKQCLAFWYWLLLLIIPAVVAALVLLLQYKGSSLQHPRQIILISIDTCRADYLGCYGYPYQTTPNIDLLAEESILFSNVISPIPITLPAHSSMLTGAIPPYHGVRNNVFFKLDEDNLTLPEILKREGFTNAAFVGSFVLDSQFGLRQGFDVYNDRFQQIHSTVSGNERRGEETTGFAIEWLKKNKDEKFFLFLHYYDPHDDYRPPEPFASRFANNLYAGEIAYTDYCIGQFLNKLKNLKIYESAFIIIAGDHGEMLGEHGEDTHTFFVYQPAIKVPLIFKLPGKTTSKRIDTTVGLVDIVPTICSFLNVPKPLHIQGQDLSPCFYKRDFSIDERFIYSESLVPTSFNASSLRAVTTDNWKYIQAPRPELYDLVNDPNENNNLFENYPKQADILKEKLRQILLQVAYAQRDKIENRMDLDEQTLEKLESLGYVGGVIVDEDFEFDQSRNDPKDMVVVYNGNQKIRELIFQKKFVQASEMCERLLLQWPDSMELHISMTKIAMNQKDFNKARYHCSKTLQIDPGQHSAYDRLGSILTELGELDEAITNFQKALQIAPDTGKYYYHLAQVFVLQGKFEEALEYFYRARDLTPHDPGVYGNLGIVFIQLGNLNEAINCFKKTLQLKPDLVQAHYSLAELYIQQKRYTEAIQHYKKLLEFDPNQYLILNRVGRIYFFQGRTELALIQWNKALKLKPDLPEVLSNLAWVKATYPDSRFRNPEESIQLAKRACEITNYEQANALDTLAAAYAATGNFPEALKTDQKALEIANSAGQQILADAIKKHMELYKQGQPYIEATSVQGSESLLQPENLGGT